MGRVDTTGAIGFLFMSVIDLADIYAVLLLSSVRVIWLLGIVKRGTLAELGTKIGLGFCWWV